MKPKLIRQIIGTKTKHRMTKSKWQSLPTCQGEFHISNDQYTCKWRKYMQKKYKITNNREKIATLTRPKYMYSIITKPKIAPDLKPSKYLHPSPSPFSFSNLVLFSSPLPLRSLRFQTAYFLTQCVNLCVTVLDLLVVVFLHEQLFFLLFLVEAFVFQLLLTPDKMVNCNSRKINCNQMILLKKNHSCHIQEIVDWDV